METHGRYRPAGGRATLELRDPRGRKSRRARVVVFDRRSRSARGPTRSQFRFALGGAFHDFWYGPSNIEALAPRPRKARRLEAPPFPATRPRCRDTFNGYDSYYPRHLRRPDFTNTERSLIRPHLRAHRAVRPRSRALRTKKNRPIPAGRRSRAASLRRRLRSTPVDPGASPRASFVERAEERAKAEAARRRPPTRRLPVLRLAGLTKPPPSGEKVSRASRAYTNAGRTPRAATIGGLRREA